MLFADAVALIVHLTDHGSSPSATGTAADPHNGGNHAPAARISREPVATSTPTTAAGCDDPRYISSEPLGSWLDGRYVVGNDEWNASGYDVAQTLYACSYSNWYVVANVSGGGSDVVKTYPNSHLNFGDTPVSRYRSILSTFAENSPHVGIHEDAYDIWLNGIATRSSTELMIWNDNYNQTPEGVVVGTASFGGRTYQVWKGSNGNGNSYIAFVAEVNFTSGTLNLLQFFDWVIAQGWMPATTPLSQVDYGAELVSTGGGPATFSFTNFSVSTS